MLRKIAAAAWAKALRQGKIGPSEVARVLPEAGTLPPSAHQAGMRAAFSAYAPELTETELARHRQLAQKRIPAIRAHEGVSPEPYMDFLSAATARDPRTGGWQVHVTPEAGEELRDLAEVTQIVHGKPPLNFSAASDPSTTLATIAHEQGELAQLQAAEKGVYSGAHATHAGVLPRLKEQLGVRDPHTRRVFDLLRQANPGDAAMTKVLRAYGNVGNYTLPPGGRAHRTLERAVIQHFPAEVAARLEGILGKSVTTLPRPKNMALSALAHLSK